MIWFLAVFAGMVGTYSGWLFIGEMSKAEPEWGWVTILLLGMIVNYFLMAVMLERVLP
jgi:F0F1-type ATP synthase assembly protein I